MNDKLRRQLESRCWAQPDGTWLVHPAVVQNSPPSFILPNEAAKQAYLAQAVPLGRLQTWAKFTTLNTSLLFVSWSSLSVAFDLGLESDLVYAVATTLIVLNVVVNLWLVPRREGRLRAWLEGAGRDARLDAGQLGEEQRPGWWIIPQSGRERCRPGWMVTADAVAMLAFAAAVALSSVRRGYRCKQAQDAWWNAAEPWSAFPSGCLDFLTALFVPVFAFALLLMVSTVWDWWRWNRRAAPPVSPA